MLLLSLIDCLPFAFTSWLGYFRLHSNVHFRSPPMDLLPFWLPCHGTPPACFKVFLLWKGLASVHWQQTHGEPAVWPALDCNSCSLNPGKPPCRGSLTLFTKKQRLRGDRNASHWVIICSFIIRVLRAMVVSTPTTPLSHACCPFFACLLRVAHRGVNTTEPDGDFKTFLTWRVSCGLKKRCPWIYITDFSQDSKAVPETPDCFSGVVAILAFLSRGRLCRRDPEVVFKVSDCVLSLWCGDVMTLTRAQRRFEVKGVYLQRRREQGDYKSCDESRTRAAMACSPSRVWSPLWGLGLHLKWRVAGWHLEGALWRQPEESHSYAFALLVLHVRFYTGVCQSLEHTTDGFL